MFTMILHVRLHRELRTTIENQLEVLQQSDGINNKTQMQIDQLQQKMKRISDVRVLIGSFLPFLQKSYTVIPVKCGISSEAYW